jgi:hypothetical protein
MSFWEELRAKILEHTTASDIAANIFEKLASSKANEILLIRPSYYLSQLSVLTMDYINYVERLLNVEDEDYAEFLKVMLYLRENAHSISNNIKEISEPLELAIQVLEESYEGETFEEEVEEEEELEAVETEELEPKEEEEAEEEEKPAEEALREDFSADRDGLEESLKVKLRTAKASDRVVEEISRCLADIYLECVYLEKGLAQLDELAPGDLAGLLAILVDLQYGLDFQLRSLLIEDIFVEESPIFNPGFLTWSSHFLQEVTEAMGEIPEEKQ